jgi:hypothetical protein
VLPEDQDWQPTTIFLASVWKATQWRVVSRDEHETLALAILFNLNTDSLAQNFNIEAVNPVDRPSAEQNMVVLLDLLTKSNCPLPSGIVFMPGPKLNIQGYRWAPQTWLGGLEIDPPDPLANSIIQEAEIVYDKGLKVTFPGFKLHDIHHPTVPITGLDPIIFPISSLLLEWYQIEPADEEKFTIAEQASSGKKPTNFAIILPRLPIMNTKEIALLVSIKEEAKNAYYVDIVRRLWARPLQAFGKAGRAKLDELRANFASKTPGNQFIGEQLGPKQNWIIDRAPDVLHSREAP